MSTLRPVESNWYRDFLFNLGGTKSRYDTAISQSGSGKRLNHLSDDPADMAYVLTLRSKINQIGQFQDNINSGKMFLSSAESALNQTMNSLYSVVSLAEQGASESTDPAGRISISDQIEQLRDGIMNYANTEINGKFVFAGSYTDTVPFTKAAAPVYPDPGAITYQGDSSVISIQADFAVTVASNIPGDEIFTDTPVDLFDRLSQLIQALRNDNTTAIGTLTSQLNESINQVSEARGTLGNRQAHLTQIVGNLTSFKTALTDKMSSLEDVNMAEALSNLSKEEVGLQAALQAGSRINRQSLMNYLG